MNDMPKGQLFSRIYLERSPAAADSKRFRHRLASWIGQHQHSLQDLARTIRNELGVSPTKPNTSAIDWAYFLEHAELRDVADTITFAYRELKVTGAGHFAPQLIEFAERALREENVSLNVDDEGGVHFFVDEEFQRARVATIAILGEAGNSAALSSYERGLQAMVGGDTLTGVRGVFDAAEGLFKQATGEPRLGSAELSKQLKLRTKLYYSDRAGDAAGLMLTGYGTWVNACHQYRHADHVPEPTPPPQEIAVALIATGSAFIRWMAETNFLQR